MTLFRRALALSTLAGDRPRRRPPRGVRRGRHRPTPPPTRRAAAESAARHGGAPVGAVYVLEQPAGRQRRGALRPSARRLARAGRRATRRAAPAPAAGSARRAPSPIDDAGRYLYAVNAGSASVTSFRIRRDGLQLIDVVASGGAMPTSVTVHGDLVYVLNAGDPGNISGFTVRNGDLEPLAGSIRPLSAHGHAAGAGGVQPRR